MIGFKDGKDSAMWAVHSAATNAARAASYNLIGQPLDTALSQMIAAAIKAGLEELLKQQYTYEDIEKDLKLNT